MAGPPAPFSGQAQLYGYGHLAEMITFSGAYAGPGFDYAETSSRAAGTDIMFLRQAPGPTVIGPYGADDLWDRTAMGQYVPDADVYTGSNGQVGDGCG